MNRPTRSFKLRLSRQGMDLLIDAHCHLIRATRRLLAWGTTLHVAVAHLETLPAELLVDELAVVGRAGLAGGEEHHLGAPTSLVGLAGAIADRVSGARKDMAAPSLGSIYLLALHILATADQTSLQATYEKTKVS